MKRTNKELYDHLASDRSSYLETGRVSSELTLPYILPRTSDRGSEANKQGFNSLGAYACKHLANKMVKALFPIGMPFFSLRISPKKLTVEEQGIDLEQVSEALQVGLKELVNKASEELDNINLRSICQDYFLHLIITGNCCIILEEDGCYLLGLDSYVVKRNAKGDLVTLITEESYILEDLPEEIAIACSKNGDPDTDKVKVYTRYQYEHSTDTYMITAEEGETGLIIGERIVPAKLLPAIVGRMNTAAGEDYGRGHVEDHLGDLHAYKTLSIARARGAATMMDVKWGVRAGAILDVQTYMEAETGDAVQAEDGDIFPIQLEKYADYRAIQAVMDEYKDRISNSFLLMQGAVRQSERTTAYEVQQTIAELNENFGGFYSRQAVELQTPLALHALDMLDPDLLETALEPKVVAGIEGIGKTEDLMKINQFSQLMAIPAQWPEDFRKDVQLDWTLYAKDVASLLNLNTPWLSEAAQQKQPTQQEQLAQQADSTLTDAATREVGKVVGQRVGQQITGEG